MNFERGDLIKYNYDDKYILVIFLQYSTEDKYQFIGRCIYSNDIIYRNNYYSHNWLTVPENKGTSIKKLFNVYTPTKRYTDKNCHT